MWPQPRSPFCGTSLPLWSAPPHTQLETGESPCLPCSLSAASLPSLIHEFLSLLCLKQVLYPPLNLSWWWPLPVSSGLSVTLQHSHVIPYSEFSWPLSSCCGHPYACILCALTSASLPASSPSAPSSPPPHPPPHLLYMLPSDWHLSKITFNHRPGFRRTMSHLPKFENNEPLVAFTRQALEISQEKLEEKIPPPTQGNLLVFL